MNRQSLLPLALCVASFPLAGCPKPCGDNEEKSGNTCVAREAADAGVVASSSSSGVGASSSAAGSSSSHVPASSTSTGASATSVMPSSSQGMSSSLAAPSSSAVTHYGAEVFVAASGGDDGNAGTREAPFASLERARQAVRDVKAAGLPADGVVVWLRGGIHARTSTLVLGTEDSGEDGKPVVWRAYPGETARLSGGTVLEPSWFSAVGPSSPVWGRVDVSAQGTLQQVDLGAHGITDFGTLERRGFYAGSAAALELSFQGTPMPLARWPDPTQHDAPQTFANDTVVLYGTATPDVTGTYQRTGTVDGVNAYQRDGLVAGKQYHLYRNTWDYQGHTYTAWFIATQASGYPSDTDPWWHHYSPDLGTFDTGTGAAGAPTIANPSSLTHGFASVTTALSDTSFTYAGDRPSRWTQAPELWLHGYWQYMWADLHTPVSTVDTATRTVTLPMVPGYGITAGQPYYAENLLEEITTPGEWYLERSTGILYFWPPADLATSETMVSLLGGPLVGLHNTSHVVLQDLVLESTRTLLVDIQGGTHNRVVGSVLRNAGTDAVSISGTDNGVERCEIAHSGDSGVTLAGGDRASLTPSGNFVRNCDIHGFSRWSWTYAPAVSLYGAGHVVAHNRLHDAPHSAILYGGNEHIIEFNNVHNVCAFSSDAGAIYAGRDWGYRGNKVRHNFIHDIQSNFEGYGVHGVYLDDCVSGIEVTGNLFYRVSGHAILHGGGRDDVMTNNVMARCGDAMAADNRGLLWIVNTPGSDWNLLERLGRDGVMYQQEPWASAYPSLAAIPNDWAQVSAAGALWLYPQGSVFSRNVGFANGAFTTESNWVPNTTTLDKYAEMADNLADQDPLFVDENALDLTLRPDSPALALPGFVPIRFSEMGIQP